jgi:hypothetical protein
MLSSNTTKDDGKKYHAHRICAQGDGTNFSRWVFVTDRLHCPEANSCPVDQY